MSIQKNQVTISTLASSCFLEYAKSWYINFAHSLSVFLQQAEKAPFAQAPHQPNNGASTDDEAQDVLERIDAKAPPFSAAMVSQGSWAAAAEALLSPINLVDLGKDMDCHQPLYLHALQVICECSSRLLFSSIQWLTNLTAFSSLW
jgi:hypothetical protein